MYNLHLSDGTTVIGMSGFIFAIILIYYYQSHSYQDLFYCCLINILSYIMFLLLGQKVSLLGHSTGIITGFLYTREFFSWIFQSFLFNFCEKILMKIFGKLTLFISFDNEKKLNNQSHIEILHEIKNDLKNIFAKCKKSADNENSLPI